MRTRPTKSIITPPTPKKNPPKPSANGTSILTEALRLYDRGFWIVPCEGKRAVVKAWDKKRLTRAELSVALKGTHRNIGIVLNQSDLIDVECDSDNAEVALHAMFDEGIPPTPTWKSKRGKHRLFRRPDGLPGKATLKIDGVEFRIGNAKGTLSVIPPSVHPDGPKYKWLPGLSIHDLEPADLPDSIIERLRAPESPTEPGGKDAIPEGKRNDTLFKLACKFCKAGLDASAVELALLIENAARCQPPLPDDEVSQIAKSAVARAEARPTNAEVLLELATTNVAYWHTPDDTAFATLTLDGHAEHWPVRSTTFRKWLAQQFYRQEGTTIGTQTREDVISTLEGRACFDGEEHPIFLRIAGHDGRIYLDLCDDTWSVVEIDADGWRIVAEPPVRFRRTKGMLPLPKPTPGGSVVELRFFVNVTDDDWLLLLAWLVMSFHPTGPYPVLKLLGEQGSAKSTTGKVLRLTVDPHVALLRRPPRSEHDLMIAAHNGWIVAYDNLSYIPPWLSDALCSLATGGSSASRTLYTDCEETFLVATRATLLNGIEDPGVRSDLVDRSITTVLPVIDEDKRQSEDELWPEFNKAHPRILGALLDAVSGALRELPNVKQRGGEWPRMKDFAQWACAAETSLGFAAGTFLQAFLANRRNANVAVLETSPVAKAIFERLKVSRNGKLEGTATYLLQELEEGMLDADKRAKAWPKAPRVLSDILTRLAPNLRAAGLCVEQGYRGPDRIWRIFAPVAPAASETLENKAKIAGATTEATGVTGASTDTTGATPEQRRTPKTPEKQGKPTRPTLPEQKTKPNLKPSPQAGSRADKKGKANPHAADSFLFRKFGRKFQEAANACAANEPRYSS